MNKKLLEEIHAHMISEFPREACGLLVANGRKQRYVPCRNMATSPSEHFILNPEDYADAEDSGKIIGIVHSHPNEASRPSDADKASCEATDLPWHIFSVYKMLDEPGQPVKITGDTAITPTGWEAPLLGRQFSFGTLDCFTLLRDFYHREMGIDLPDFDRTGKDKFWERGEDLYMDNFKKFGFVVADGPMEKGDLILMNVRSPIVNHVGVFLGDVHGVGSYLFLHHPYGALSTRDVYGGYWAEITRCVLRYAK